MSSPSPLILRLAHWPAADKSRWAALFDDEDLFEPGPATHWSNGGIRLREQGYGRWLGFLAAEDRALLTQPPDERIRPDLVDRFIAAELARVKPRSVLTSLDCLFAFARMAYPDGDWTWLLRALKRLKARHGSGELKPRPALSAGEISQWARRRLKRLSDSTGMDPMRRAIDFRDAFMIGLLIARPVRARAYVGIRLGLQLLPCDTGYRLEFRAEDMKDKRRHSYDVPNDLLPWLALYLQEIRPVLLGKHTSDTLWITHHGKPMAYGTLVRSLPEITRQQLGVRLGPHAFRHVAATTIAIENPGKVGIIREVLGHATLAMAEKHYNRATSLESCDALQKVVVRDLQASRKVTARTSRKDRKA